MALSSQKSSSVLSDDCWFSTIGVKQNLLECHIILTAFVLKPLLKHKNIKKMKVYSLIIYTFCTTNHQNCFQQTVLHSFQSNVINTLNVTCSLWIMSTSFIFLLVTIFVCICGTSLTSAIVQRLKFEARNLPAVWSGPAAFHVLTLQGVFLTSAEVRHRTRMCEGVGLPHHHVILSFKPCIEVVPCVW